MISKNSLNRKKAVAGKLITKQVSSKSAPDKRRGRPTREEMREKWEVQRDQRLALRELRDRLKDAKVREKLAVKQLACARAAIKKITAEMTRTEKRIKQQIAASIVRKAKAASLAKRPRKVI